MNFAIREQWYTELNIPIDRIVKQVCRREIWDFRVDKIENPKLEARSEFCNGIKLPNCINW
jgi:hypothetical protein